MLLENWVPDLDRIEQESEYLTSQYGPAVAARYRKIALTPPASPPSPGKRAVKSPKWHDGKITTGMKMTIKRCAQEYQLTPRQIGRKWSLPVAAVREVLAELEG